jgi:hypothetical protein
MREHASSSPPNPKERIGQSRPTQRASDGVQELGWSVEKTGFCADEKTRQRQLERSARKAGRVRSQVEGHNRRQMMVHRATLIAGLARSVLTMTIVLMRMIDVANDCDIFGDGDLALINMMEVDSDE